MMFYAAYMVQSIHDIQAHNELVNRYERLSELCTRAMMRGDIPERYGAFLEARTYAHEAVAQWQEGRIQQKTC